MLSKNFRNFDELLEGINFKEKGDKEILCSFLKNHFRYAFVENGWLYLDDNIDYILFSDITSGYFEGDLSSYIDDIKETHNCKNYNETVDLIKRVENIANYTYEEVRDKIIKISEEEGEID